MRLLPRRPLATAAAASLALAIAAGGMWRRSTSAYDRASRFVGGARYTLVSYNGVVTLYAPPLPAKYPDTRRAIDELAGKIRNEHVVVAVNREGFGTSATVMVVAPDGVEHHGARIALVGEGREHALLAAMEDPGRFAAAQVLLARRRPPGRSHVNVLAVGSVEPRPGVQPVDFIPGSTVRLESAFALDTGLFFALGETLDPEAVFGKTPSGRHAFDLYAAVADPADQPRILTLWHEHLDRTVVSVRWQTIVLLTLILPVLWLFRFACRYRALRTASRAGLCPNCGYDLRATPDRCPECGRVGR